MSETNQKDLVLSINEYAYVLDETKGHVSCLVGPTKMSLSQSDKLVLFNPYTKFFEPCGYNDAKSLFTTAPENWYVILKNPAEGNRHPTPGSSNTLPDNIHVGQKVNVRGPVSFALYPGQMAKVIKGHTLRTNQYLLARVYEADAANTSQGEIRDPDGNIINDKSKNYVNGQILVIKGTEVSFYIPPTGIEVIPVGSRGENYVRDAVTLERLEYCILKDENGSKRYLHGPQVVFPEPTETFVTSPKGGFIFRAIELSKISGIYVKVIAEYEDEDKTIHPVGEELFITGDQQMIYYPRPEHAIITYDNKIMHHAIAIPEGEGRYVMNRLTGEIKTVKGPEMYLPDPRTEVIVKRKLSPRECSLMYPGNTEALNYNIALNEKAVEKSLKAVDVDNMVMYSATNSLDSTLASLEAKANISRGTSYTKPRTITLDNKFDGIVSVDVWTGYAVNKVSKNGTREVVCGPQTVMLDYDQVLEEIVLSTGNPKNTDDLEHTVFLNYENNKVSDTINIETKDFVKASIKVSYCVNFETEYKNRWFDVENYVKYLCDRMRSLVKRMAKNYNIEEFYQNYSELVRNVAIDYDSSAEKTDNSKPGRFFPENGMRVTDCEVLAINVEREIAKVLNEHQYDMVQKSLELTNAEKRVKVAEKLAEAEQKEQELRSQSLINEMNLKREEAVRKLEIQTEINRQTEAEKLAAKQAEQDMQPILDAIHEAGLARTDKENQQEIAHEKQVADIEKAKQEAYAATVAKIMGSISPDLIASMTSSSNAELITALSESVAPYAIAQNESISTVVNKMTRGLPIEDILKNPSMGVSEE